MQLYTFDFGMDILQKVIFMHDLGQWLFKFFKCRTTCRKGQIEDFENYKFWGGEQKGQY